MLQGAAAEDWQFAAAQLVDNLALGRLLTGLEADQLVRAFADMPTGTPGPAPALVGAACRLAEQDLPGCEAELRRADATLAPSADDPLADACGPAARFGRAFLGVLAGRPADDLTAVERAAAGADRLLRELPPALVAERPELHALLLAHLGAVELGAGRLDRAGSTLTAAVAACGPPGTEAPLRGALGSLALTELLRGRLRQAAEHANASLAVAERSALPAERRSGIDHLVLAGVAVEQDDLPAARHHLDLATAAPGPRPDPATAARAAVIGARIAAAEGDGDAALAALRAVDAAGLPAWAADALAEAESAVHLAGGDAAAALRVLDAAPAPDADRPERALARTRALLDAGRPADAERALAGVPADDGVPTPVRAHACLLRARIAEARGDCAQAHRYLDEALALARPEELRRIFTESGPWVRRTLREDPRTAWSHGRPAPAPRPVRPERRARRGPRGSHPWWNR